MKQRTQFLSTARLRGGAALLALAFLAYAVGTLVFAYFARGNYDEEFFLYTGALTYQGNVPYRDFLFMFGPLTPIVYGAPQEIFGPSILAGRITAWACSLVTAFAGGYLAWRLNRGWGTAVFLSLLATNLLILRMFVVPKSESLLAPLLMVALALWISRPRSPAALFLVASFLLWASAVRQTAMPVSIVLIGLLLYQLRNQRTELVVLVAALAGQAMVLFGAFAITARGNMLYGMFQVHWSIREGGFAIGDRLSSVVRYPVAISGDFFGILIPAALVLAILFVHVLRGWRPDLSKLDADPKSAMALLLLTAALVFAPHMFLRFAVTHYFAVSAAILAVAAASLTPELSPWPSRRVVSGLLIGVIIAQGIVFGVRQATYLDVRASPVRTYANIGAYVSDTIGPGGQLVTLHPGYALVDGLPLPAELAMGAFSYDPVMSTKRADELRITNPEIIEDLLRNNNTELVILDDFSRLWLLPVGGLPSELGGEITLEELLQQQQPRTEEEDLDPMDALEQTFFSIVPTLEQEGYRLDRSFEERFGGPARHAFVR